MLCAALIYTYASYQTSGCRRTFHRVLSNLAGLWRAAQGFVVAVAGGMEAKHWW